MVGLAAAFPSRHVLGFDGCQPTVVSLMEILIYKRAIDKPEIPSIIIAYFKDNDEESTLEAPRREFLVGVKEQAIQAEHGF